MLGVNLVNRRSDLDGKSRGTPLLQRKRSPLSGQIFHVTHFPGRVRIRAPSLSDLVVLRRRRMILRLPGNGQLKNRRSKMHSITWRALSNEWSLQRGTRKSTRPAGQDPSLRDYLRGKTDYFGNLMDTPEFKALLDVPD